MKYLILLLSLIGLALSSGLTAYADQSSFVGTDAWSENGMIDFTEALQAGTSSGIFTSFAGGTTTFSDFNFMSYSKSAPMTITKESGNSSVLTFVLSTEDYQYALVPVTNLGAPADEMNLSITGRGTYYLNGIAVALGSFDLTTQGVPGAQGFVTFSETSYATELATPEPSSFVLLGSGLLGIAGCVVRRARRT